MTEWLNWTELLERIKRMSIACKSAPCCEVDHFSFLCILTLLHPCSCPPLHTRMHPRLSVWTFTLFQLTKLLCYTVPDIPHSLACLLSHFSRVWLFAALWTVACQVPLCMGFSRQECWSGFPCPPLGGLPNPGMEPMSPALTGWFFPAEPPGKTWESLRAYWNTNGLNPCPELLSH